MRASRASRATASLTFITALATFAGPACTKDELVFVPRPTAPADIAYVAVLIADSGGNLLSATGLVPWTAEHPIRLEGLHIPESATIEVSGWSNADLALLGSPSDDVLARGTMREAAGCDAVFPSARYRARFDQRGSALPSLPTARRLTTDWLNATCPDLSNSVSVDVRCMVRACPGFTKQEGCTLTFDLDNCTEGVHRAQVDWQGKLCGLEARSGCSYVDPDAPALASIACNVPDSCDIDVYGVPETPAFTIDSVPLVSGVTPRAPEQLAMLGVRGWASYTGYLSGLTFQGGRVIVTSFDGRFWPIASCRDPAPTRTMFIDPETMEVTATATTPPCLRNLLAPPGASGFYGVAGSTRARSLVELDGDGHVLGAHALDLPLRPNRSFDDVALILARDQRRFFVLVRWYDENESQIPHGSIIYEIERGTFRQRVLFAQGSGIPWGLVESDDGRLVIADEDDDILTIIDGTRGTRAQEPIALFHVTSVSAGVLGWFQPTREVLVPIAFAEDLMHLVSLTNVTDHYVIYYEKPAGPLVTSDWPADPELVATGAAYSGTGVERDAWFSLFEPRKRRFLPGAMRIGYGVPGQMLPEGRRVWITLPWEGALARVTPK